ncbi:MAG: nucleotidyl transferase AbiEii/AbiGii toxin family protein [Chlorobi bacterium]|nr:nucleotidyl transferase AbiEii/AbiGii toxin family protein [Chlorobiota bacterium]
MLEYLASNKLEFIFKGGTALILLLDNANRFSIDIDISTERSKEELESILDKIIEFPIFANYKLDARRSYKGKLQKAHYKFYYDSQFSTSNKNVLANYVLLDIVFEKAVYPEFNELEIKTKWLDTIEPYTKITVPSINSILGDKLTAFAPNTTGVQYNKNKELEIIKQLFDVSALIDVASNIEIVKDSFSLNVEKEIEYRSIDVVGHDVLDDIFLTALLIAKREKNIDTDKLKFTEIQRGIRNLFNYIIFSHFRIDEAIKASAKSAWFAMKLKNANYLPIEIYNPEIDVALLQIENKACQFLNKLKKANKAAFYYWLNVWKKLANYTKRIKSLLILV